jgi:transcription elongation factor SPT5
MCTLGRPNGQLEPLEGPGAGKYSGSSYHGSPASNTRTPNPYAQGGRTPAWGSSGRTPNPYAVSGDVRTPAWNVGSRTPNPYATDGGRTPAWSATSRTPNPYAAADGGRTPAWTANSRTPNPYSAGAGWGAENLPATSPRQEPMWNEGAWGASDPWVSLFLIICASVIHSDACLDGAYTGPCRCGYACLQFRADTCSCCYCIYPSGILAVQS